MFSFRSRRDPAPLNADLHCHSTVSDGTLEPAALAERAHANGVQLWALTDHDELGGLERAALAAEKLGLPFVPGVEISVTWGSETLHIVGLRIDRDNAALRDGLEQTRSGRTRRARAMADQLAAVGIPDAFEGALNYVGNPDLIGRTHFARYIVEINRCDDVREVFTKYLVAGKPGYVPVQWATLAEAVGWIRAAGGVAVIAHPGRYKLNDGELRELFAQFQGARRRGDRGGDRQSQPGSVQALRDLREGVRVPRVARLRLPRSRRKPLRLRQPAAPSRFARAGLARLVTS